MALWEPTTCCGCCKVRTGSIVLAVFFLVVGCLNLLSGLRTLIVIDDNVKQTCDVLREFLDSAPEGCEENTWKTEMGTASATVVIGCFQVIFNSLLLHGILKKKTAFFVPLMIAYAIQIVLMILLTVILIILYIVFGASPGIIILVGGLLGLVIFLETYFLLVIRAHYYEIKREKAQVHTALNDRNEVEEPPYLAAQLPPPYPTSEVPPYPSSEVPLYPNIQKVPK